MAFVLLIGEVDSFPSDGVWADILIFVGRAWKARDAIWRHGVQDAEVYEVPEIGPDAEEHDEVGRCEDAVEVVEDFGGLDGLSLDVLLREKVVRNVVPLKLSRL